MASGGQSDTLKDTYELLFVSRQDRGVTRYSGWKIELLVEEIVSVSEQKLLLCTLCKGMLRDACVVTLDGKKQARCSVCVPSDIQFDALNNADLIRSVIDDRMINCPFLNEGCKWSGSTPEIHLHLKECQYLHVPCPLKCLEPNATNLKVIQKIQRRFIQDHISQTCLMRFIPCEYCQNKVQASNINSHFAICLDYPTQCMNKCTFQSLEGKVFVASRRIVRKHLESDCPLQQVMCPYSKHGCKFQIVRKNIQAHKVEFTSHHFQLMEAIISDFTFHKQSYIGDLESRLKLEMQLNNQKVLKKYHIPGNTPVEWKFSYLANRKRTNVKFHSSKALSCGYCYSVFIEFNRKSDMGVFFYLVKGDNDDQLEWPLKCKITFTLLNQLKSHVRLTKEIYSEDHSENKCFDKPISNGCANNVGCSNFISHDDIIYFGCCTEGFILLEVIMTCL